MDRLLSKVGEERRLSGDGKQQRQRAGQLSHSEAPTTMIHFHLAVFAQTADKQWLRIADNNWIKASDVKPVSLPDGIPIENP